MSELKRGTYPAMMKDPFADAVTQPFWDATLQDMLVAPRCVHCGTFVLTPQPFCFNCQGQGFDWVELPGSGTRWRPPWPRWCPMCRGSSSWTALRAPAPG
jgi:hypothetical protein